VNHRKSFVRRATVYMPINIFTTDNEITLVQMPVVSFFFCLGNNCFRFSFLSAVFLKGTFSGDMIRVLSDIRLKHGQESVRLPSCGRFALTNHLVNVADITYVDLSSIILLKGKHIVNCLDATQNMYTSFWTS